MCKYALKGCNATKQETSIQKRYTFMKQVKSTLDERVRPIVISFLRAAVPKCFLFFFFFAPKTCNRFRLSGKMLRYMFDISNYVTYGHRIFHALRESNKNNPLGDKKNLFYRRADLPSRIGRSGLFFF